MDRPLDVDQIWNSLGKYGKFQKIQMFLMLFSVIPLAFHLLSTVFIAYRPPYKCSNTTAEEIFPGETDKYINTSYHFVYNKCSIDVYNTTSNSTLLKSTECVSGFTYPVPKDRTLVTEWNLVCDGAERAEFSQTLVILGQAFGAAIFTSFADRYGRKTVHVLSHISMFAISFAISWTPNYTVFATLRFFLGAVQQGSGLTMAILLLETLPLESRYVGEVLGLFFWTTGVNLLSPIGYIFRNLSWRYLQMALALFSVYSLIEYWIMEESLRWLLANGKTKEAERIIRKAAKMNGKNFDKVIEEAASKARELTKFIPQNNKASSPMETNGGTTALPNGTEKSGNTVSTDIIYTNDEQKEDITMTTASQRYNVTTIFRHKRILLNSLIVWYLWVVNSLVYYALSLTASVLSGDRFINYFLIAIVEYPAALVEFLIVNRIGRRKTCMLFHAIAGVALTISTICLTLSGGHGILNTVSLAFNLVGKFGITGSFSTIFLYTPELYPTNLRNAGIGVSSSVARIGGMVAPFSGPLMGIITWGPGAISAALCLFAVVMISCLPETKGYELPTTIEELKLWYKDHAGDKNLKQAKQEEMSL